MKRLLIVIIICSVVLNCADEPAVTEPTELPIVLDVTGTWWATAVNDNNFSNTIGGAGPLLAYTRPCDSYGYGPGVDSVWIFPGDGQTIEFERGGTFTLTVGFDAECSIPGIGLYTGMQWRSLLTGAYETFGNSDEMNLSAAEITNGQAIGQLKLILEPGVRRRRVPRYLKLEFETTNTREGWTRQYSITFAP